MYVCLSVTKDIANCWRYMVQFYNFSFLWFLGRFITILESVPTSYKEKSPLVKMKKITLSSHLTPFCLFTLHNRMIFWEIVKNGHFVEFVYYSFVSCLNYCCVYKNGQTRNMQELFYFGVRSLPPYCHIRKVLFIFNKTQSK